MPSENSIGVTCSCPADIWTDGCLLFKKIASKFKKNQNVMFYCMKYNFEYHCFIKKLKWNALVTWDMCDQIFEPTALYIKYWGGNISSWEEWFSRKITRIQRAKNLVNHKNMHIEDQIVHEDMFLEAQ